MLHPHTFFLLRALAFVIVAAIAVDRERWTGDVPNALTLGGLAVGLGLAFASPNPADSLIGLAVVAVPTLWAFTRGWVDATVVRLALGMGALLSPIAAGVTLVLGIVWVQALLRQQASWRKASRTPPRLASSPRVVALATLGGLVGASAALIP